MKTARNELICENCKRKLNPKRMVWLEIDSRKPDEWREIGVIAEEYSQGCFPFGLDCYKTMKKKIKRWIKNGKD